MPIDDQLSVDEALSTTRSVRRRIDFDRPVEPEVLEACIDVATQAPTGAGAERWRFVIVTDAEKKLALAEIYRRALGHFRHVREEEALRTGAEPPEVKATHMALADRMHEMPALVVACIEGRPTETVAQQVAFYGSILPAAWSFMVALRARGLGSTWTTLHLLYEKEAAAIMSIPSDVTQTVLIPVGYTRNAVLRTAERSPAREVTFWNEWGSHAADDPV